MKKYFILLPLVALVFTGLFTAPVYAMDNMPYLEPSFGQHIATMTPEHPKIHGVMFGQMVSSMAQGISCP